MFKTTLFLIASLVGLASGQFDTSWELVFQDNPTIAFNYANRNQEVILRYDVNGASSETSNKYLEAIILASGCVGTGTSGAITISDSLSAGSGTYDGLLTTTVDIVNTAITGSSYFTDNLDQTATINFCVRVDYYYQATGQPKQSMTFHETEVSLTLDLKANFSITSITVTPLAATDVTKDNLTVGYKLNAYHCANADNGAATAAPVFHQRNSLLSICVEVQDAAGFMYVRSIRQLTITQPATGLSTNLITAGAVNGAFVGITDIDCVNIPQKCQIQNQLNMIFFETNDHLVISGTAEVAFGQERKLLTVPISARYLGESTTADIFLTADVRQIDDEGLGVVGTSAVVGAGVVAIAVVAFVAIKVLGTGSANTDELGAKAAVEVGGTASSTADILGSIDSAENGTHSDEEVGTVGSGLPGMKAFPFVSIPPR